MSHTIQDLRTHLFDTLAGLRDKENPMDIERAKAVADVAQTIINSAKVEVEFMKTTDQTSGSGFIPLAAPEEGAPGTAIDKLKGTTTTVSLLQGGVRRTVHKTT
ncbi:MAG: hypothetical protein ABIK08_11225 [Pseudomonadota bacterium]